MSLFDVRAVLAFPGVKEEFTLHDITATVMDDRGDVSNTFTDYTLYGAVQQIAGGVLEDREGSITEGDLIILVSDQSSYVTNIDIKDELTWRSNRYIITDVLFNPGHYEFVAKKI